MITALGQASILALVSMFMGVLPLGMGVVYAIWPTEQRLGLMRPLSLTTIFCGGERHRPRVAQCAALHRCHGTS